MSHPGGPENGGGDPGAERPSAGRHAGGESRLDASYPEAQKEELLARQEAWAQQGVYVNARGRHARPEARRGERGDRIARATEMVAAAAGPEQAEPTSPPAPTGPEPAVESSGDGGGVWRRGFGRARESGRNAGRRAAAAGGGVAAAGRAGARLAGKAGAVGEQVANDAALRGSQIAIDSGKIYWDDTKTLGRIARLAGRFGKKYWQKLGREAEEQRRIGERNVEVWAESQRRMDEAAADPATAELLDINDTPTKEIPREEYMDIDPGPEAPVVNMEQLWRDQVLPEAEQREADRVVETAYGLLGQEGAGPQRVIVGGHLRDAQRMHMLEQVMGRLGMMSTPFIHQDVRGGTRDYYVSNVSRNMLLSVRHAGGKLAQIEVILTPTEALQQSGDKRHPWVPTPYAAEAVVEAGRYAAAHEELGATLEPAPDLEDALTIAGTGSVADARRVLRRETRARIEPEAVRDRESVPDARERTPEQVRQDRYNTLHSFLKQIDANKEKLPPSKQLRVLDKVDDLAIAYGLMTPTKGIVERSDPRSPLRALSAAYVSQSASLRADFELMKSIRYKLAA